MCYGRLFVLWAVILFCFSPVTVCAQTEEERYRAIYDQAEQDYNIGRLEQAEEILTGNLKNFPLSLRQSAYRML